MAAHHPKDYLELIELNKSQLVGRIRRVKATNEKLKKDNQKLREQVKFLEKTIDWMSENSGLDLAEYINVAKRIALDAKEEVQRDLLDSSDSTSGD